MGTSGAKEKPKYVLFDFFFWLKLPFSALWIFFDEATSALDGENEAMMMDLVARMKVRDRFFFCPFFFYVKR